MNIEEPYPSPSRDERELLLSFLRRQRAEVIATSTGLTEEQARWTPDGRLLPIIGILNHLTRSEWRWINGRYLREPFPERDDEFIVDIGRTLSDVVAAYRQRGKQTEAIIRSSDDLGAECLGTEGGLPPAHVQLQLSSPVDLRWALLHLIEEIAHHAGHADATRELIDGTRMR